MKAAHSKLGPDVVTVAEAATVLGISRQAVSAGLKRGRLKHWREDGRIVVARDGLERRWWGSSQRLADRPTAAHDLERSIAQLPDDAIPDLTESRARREHFEAELALLRLEQQRGDLVPADEVRKQAFAMGRTVRDALMGVPDRVAAQLSGMSDAMECHRLLTEELRTALRALTEATASD